MAKKVGTCVNIDCENYKQEIEIEPGGEFECPLCHQPLREKNGGGGGKHNDDGNGNGNGKKIALIIAAVAVLGGLIYGIFFTGGGEEPKKEGLGLPENTVEVKPDSLKEGGDTITINVDSSEEKNDTEIERNSNPSVVNGRGTVDLGYGTYTGDLKNCKPHGYGVITYKQAHNIVNSKDFVAQPGDKFEGEFRNGRISGLGYWKHDGNETAVKP